MSNSQPVSEVSGVGQGRGEAHHSDALGGVRGDEVGPGHNDLQHWTPVLTWNTVQHHILSQRGWLSIRDTELGSSMHEVRLCIQREKWP